MLDLNKHFIDGAWSSSSGDVIEAIDPSTETVFARVARGTANDVDHAVNAARAAFPAFAATPVGERIRLLEAIASGLEARRTEISEAMSVEMGVPRKAADAVHFPSGPAHFREAARVLASFAFDEQQGSTMVTHEPIGVCGLITPWNFPINQVACKVAPALAAGCTMVLKPSEISPWSAAIIAEVIADAGAPSGTFNLVQGDGLTTGSALTVHPLVDMISFTGSTRAGVEISKAAADTVKRVTLELGGKSPNIILPDADLEDAVSKGVARCFNNSGQSCIAPTRMLVPRPLLEKAEAIAARVAGETLAGPADSPGSVIGPVANAAQFAKVQAYIEAGVASGARLVAGGPGRPDGIVRGFVVQPTVFSDVDPSMAIAREEIFGPVLCLIPYEDENDAVRIANDIPYGLAAFVQGRDMTAVRRVARQMRAGIVQMNYPPVDRSAPFGGYKQSGNGREWGVHGLREYLEVKAMVGFGEA
ncbi:aldehyde dehydrogenase family protein [Futiania mangrovi]|uniref:aldehyde dehydrogenase (NAD(+)) n=1 Tax=Futiania mangrovi TaxID=2959716 RepID=A0A9J6PH60_9PROT|nr:aldehyde dehydrogenase family protein [Futiania mangrovii]MCP1337147.1 aldehyde dehydrogenase family protein [Futiania mangrovii]